MLANQQVQSDKTTSSFDAPVSVKNLEIGMTVTDLDCDWLDTPFLTQGFTIKSQDEIETLSRYCRFVWIEQAPPQLAYLPHKTIKPKKDNKNTPNSSNTYSLHDELDTFSPLVDEARRYALNLMGQVRSGMALNTAEAKRIVEQTITAVVRNPDAILWLTRMKREDNYTAEHLYNVCVLACVFGKKLGFNEEQLHELGMCGLLHDVGKLKIPHSILGKPSRLSDDEFKCMQTHTNQGKKLLKENDQLDELVIDVAFSHHERPDGRGYPRSISANSISFFSKIISIVDAYDAMTAKRVYSKPRSSTSALKVIYEECSQQFDEKLALSFIQTIGLYPPGTIVELVNGCVGVVTENNSEYRHLPRVMVLLDDRKVRCPRYEVDLTATLRGGLAADYLIRYTHQDGSFALSLAACFENGWLRPIE